MDAFLYSSHHENRHIRRDCPERKAVFVTKSEALTYALDGTVVNTESTGKQSGALSRQRRALTQIQLVSKNPSKGGAVSGRGVATKAKSPAAGMYSRT